MRVHVVSDLSGNIVAIVPSASLKPKGEDAPSRIAIVPDKGQSVHEIALPAEMARMPLPEIAQGFRVEKGKLERVHAWGMGKAKEERKRSRSSGAGA